MQEQIMWTLLPKGTSSENNTTYLNFSVFLSVRLTPDSPNVTLAAFNRMVNWPGAIGNLGQQLSISFDGGSPQAVTVDQSLIESGLWGKVFPESTPVKGFEQKDYAQKRIHSYPVKHLDNYLVQQYARAGVISPDDLVPTWELIPVMEEISNYGDTLRRFGDSIGPVIEGQDPLDQDDFTHLSVDKSEINRINKIMEAKKFVPFDITGKNTERYVAQMDEFYAHSVKKSRIADLKPPVLDFHERHTALTDFPVLLRKLGLIIEIKVPAPQNLPANGTVKLHHSTFSNDIFPSTSYKTNPTFQLEEGNLEAILKDGFLKIGDTSLFHTSQVETEGSTLKLKNTANDLAQRLILRRKVRAKEGLPSLRTAPVTVSNNGYAERLHKRFLESNNLETLLEQNQDINLTADHVLSGYRMDIYDEEKGQWFSLFRRKGTYKMDDENLISTPVEDEGFSQAGVTEATPDTYDQDDDSSKETDDLYASENQFSWDGWSLAVPRPEDAVETESSGNTLNEPFVDANFEVVPGSLPRLRFGKTYRIRIRAVDLAGNSVSWEDDLSDPELISELTYLRFEPANSPAILNGNVIKDGESMERMVVRSNGDRMDANMFAGKYNKHDEEAYNLLPGQIKVKALRFFLPPEVDFGIAEKHGAFDEGIGSDKANNKIVQQFNIIKNHDHTPPANPNTQYHPNPAGDDVVFDEQRAIVTKYLPDPIAEGLAIWKGNPKKLVFKVPFYPDNKVWPDPRPVRIRLIPHDGPLELDTSQLNFSILKFKIPAGTEEKLYISCYISKETLENEMGHWPKLLEYLAKGGDPIPQAQQNRMEQFKNYIFGVTGTTCKTWTPEELEQLITDGGHWLFTPPRPLQLVHAVQQPIEPPQIQQLTAFRHPNSTEAYLEANIGVHGNSTGKVELFAEWEEPLDDLQEDKPKTLQKRMLVEDQKVGYEETVLLRKEEGNLTSNTYIEHLFNDTKHRMVTYRIDGTTRYREYFTNIISKLSKAEFPLSVSGNTLELNIKNSARPLTPEVHSIIPLLKWKRSVNKQPAYGEDIEVREHEREGGWLRVYLKRPWYSSGAGELLGVVCLNPAYALQQQYEDEDCGYRNDEVTRWANDPINYQVFRLDQYPTVADFSGFVSKEERLVLPGEESEAYDVVGYPVHYDESRQLWYADVKINLPDDKYFPFIRFSLARYQPNSIARGDLFINKNEQLFDYHLSKFVEAEFIQVLPERKCQFSIMAEHRNKVAVELEGPIALTAPPNSTSPKPSAFVTIHVEEQVGEGANSRFIMDPTETRVLSFKYYTDGNAKAETLYAQNLAFKKEPYYIKLSEKYKTRPYRLMITEWETRLVDGVRRGRANIQGGLPAVPGARMVFSDLINVNEGGVSFEDAPICWDKIGDLPTNGNPVSRQWDFAHVDAFIRGQNGNLWRNSFDQGKWEGWIDLKREVAENAKAAVLSRVPKKLELVVRDDAKNLWYYSIQEKKENDDWIEDTNNWSSLGGPFLCDPTLVSWGVNRLDLFCQGVEGDVLINHLRNNEWQGWRTLGLPFEKASAIGAATRLIDQGTRKGEIYVSVKSEERELWINRGEGEEEKNEGNLNYGRWKNLGGPIDRDPKLAFYKKELYVFTHEGGTVKYLVPTLDDNIWHDLPGIKVDKNEPLYALPILQSIGYWVLDVITKDADDYLFRNRWDGEVWSGWKRIYDGPVAGPVHASAGFEQVHLTTQSLKNRLWYGSYLAPLMK